MKKYYFYKATFFSLDGNESFSGMVSVEMDDTPEVAFYRAEQDAMHVSGKHDVIIDSFARVE